MPKALCLMLGMELLLLVRDQIHAAKLHEKVSICQRLYGRIAIGYRLNPRTWTKTAFEDGVQCTIGSQSDLGHPHVETLSCKNRGNMKLNGEDGI